MANSTSSKRRRRKILWIFIVVILLFAGLHIVGVDAKAPEFIAGIVETVNPPKPIVKSNVLLPASVQSAIVDLAKQEIQQQNANATLPSATNLDKTIPKNVSILQPFINDVQIAVTADPVQRAKIRLAKIDTYIAELENLLANDRSTSAVNKAVSLLEAIGAETGKVASDPIAQSDRQVLTLLIQQYNKLQIVIQKVEDVLPMDSYLKVESARVKYILGPAQVSLNNASNLDVVNNIGIAEVKKYVGDDFAELKAIEILTDLSVGLTPQTQTKLNVIQKQLAGQFEKRMLKLPVDVRQRKLDDYMNFSYGNPINQVKAFNQMQGFLTNKQLISGIGGLKEIALQKLSERDPKNQLLEGFKPMAISKVENQKLFETVQRITQDIFLTKSETNIEKLFSDNVQQEISKLKVELPARNIPELALPDGVTLPDVAKLPDDVNNAIITAAKDKINEEKKPADLKLNLHNLAGDLGISVPAILPDSPLYSIEEIIRKVELLVTTDPIARAELLLKQDNEKTIEAAKLVEDSQSVQSVDLALKTLASVNSDFNLLKSHTDEIKTLETTEPQKVDELVSQIVDNGLARQTVFSEIESKIHGDSYVAVENVRGEVLTSGVNTLLALTNNDVSGLTTKLETAVAKEDAGKLSDIKAVELLNEIARTQPEETKTILQTSETKLAKDLQAKIESIPEASRTKTVLAYADNVSGNPVRELEAYDVLKNNFTNPDTIVLTGEMKSEAISNLTSRIAEISDAGTLQNFVDNIVGSEPQDLKAAIEIEANVAPLPTTTTTVTEVLPIVQKVEDVKANILENVIDTYKDKPDELAKTDFFDNPTLKNKTPDVVDIQVVQELQTALSASPDVQPAVVGVVKQEETKIIDTFVANISNPQFQDISGASELAPKTLNPTPETLANLIDLQTQVPAVDRPSITLAINAQVNIMQNYLATQVTDPTTFQTYVHQIAEDPVVAQVVQNVSGGTSFQNAIKETSQVIEKQAETDHTQLTDTVKEIQQEVFSAPVNNPSTVQQTLPQPIQVEIQQIKEELPVAQIPAVTVEAAVQVNVPAPAAPEPVAPPAPVAPSVGL